jgi:hypothetical protein
MNGKLRMLCEMFNDGERLSEYGILDYLRVNEEEKTFSFLGFRDEGLEGFYEMWASESFGWKFNDE